MTSRSFSPLVVLALAVAALTGCSPIPAPTPSPIPAFASENEAFAAAEKTYRAYNDAVNAERVGKSTASPRDYLIGPALEGDTETRQAFKAQGLTVAGDGVIANLTLDSVSVKSKTASAALSVCLDVSNTRVLDGDGDDVTPAQRVPRIALSVSLVTSEQRFLISESTTKDELAC